MLTMRTINRWSARSFYVTALCALLAACSGGNGNDKVRIGSGQAGNPVTKAADFPIFYVKRTTPNFVAAVGVTVADDDVRHQNVCRNNKLCTSNADLFMRDRAATSANEYNITARVRKKATEVWDVKDVDVSPDATKAIFAMRGPLRNNQKPNDPPTWNIWEYDIAKDDLHRVITDDVSAEEGQDVSPHYLPDGHIIFSSTRQRDSKAILLDEGKPQFAAQDENRHEAAFVLHVMNGDGTSVQQLSFNQSHDLQPTVMSDGRLLFSRWDHAPGRDGMHLYTSNPDGTNTQLLYGSASHNTIADVDPTVTPSATVTATTFPNVEFLQPHETQSGSILTVVRPYKGTEYGGDLYLIDAKNFVENEQPIAASSTLTGTAQTKVWANNVRLLTAPSPGGRFVSAIPLWDGTGRILVAWSQCRLLDPADGVTIVPCSTTNLASATTNAAPPIYSVWMFDPVAQTMQPIVVPQEGVMMSDVAIAQPRPAQTYLPYNLDSNPAINATFKGEGVGVLDIRSVYDFDGTLGGGVASIAAISDPGSSVYTNRRAWFLRIEKAVSLPDKTVRDVDFQTALGAAPFMREIVGYVPIEPDGSVRTKVPANVALQIAVTDDKGNTLAAFPRHNAWITVRGGEVLQCNGCHTPTVATTLMNGQSGVSHGRSGLFVPLYKGATAANAAFSNANTQFLPINAGDTMAQARSVWSCISEKCASITPNVNMIFANVWPSGNDANVVPAAARTGDTLLTYTGAMGVPLPPTSSNCTVGAWSSLCRIVINYPDHIQKIWNAPRNETTDMAGNLVSANTCTFCHNHNAPTNPAQLPIDKTMITAANVAAWQLDLRGIVPDNADNANYNTTQFVSYQELFFGDTVINADPTTGAIAPLTVLVPTGQVDAMGNPILAPQPVDLSGTRLNSLNAVGSRFFRVFSANQCQHTTIVTDGTGKATGANTSTGACSVNHQAWLTPGELRLITEWVEIGGQYYNDPFKAPVN